MTSADPTLALDTRRALPDALRVLNESFPRADWEAHPNFGELVRFWMSRHVMFREVLDRLSKDLNAVLWADGDEERHRHKLGRYGQFLLQELHAHHHIEDHHYFPKLVGLDPRIDHGFEVLETDHQAIDQMLAEFANAANSVLSGNGGRDALGHLDTVMSQMTRNLNRHLIDEEDLIVPVILKSGFTG